MQDYIIRATAANGYVRAFAATTKNTVETARAAHNTSPVATAALGRLLTAGAMMGVMMKGEDDVLTLKIEGNGPIEGLTVIADSHGNVKGYAFNPTVLIPANDKGKLDVAGALGIGVLTIIKDLGLKEPYIGQTILVTSEIAEDLTYYFATSEQTPSSVALGVLMNRNNTVRQAGGFILQLMPGADESVISALESRLAEIKSITALLDEGMTPEDILERLLGDMDLEIMDKLPTQFYCNCDKHRIERAIVAIGESDLQEMIDDGQPIDVCCDFCNSHYEFSVEDLRDIIRRGKHDRNTNNSD
ncbi:MAG: Hsp33 family molecular chaperone HslO [Lachnospiraceae bacterium]|nr:Hsp33 family molecular chaperone HslO [Lachnospiraceae bacterium]